MKNMEHAFSDKNGGFNHGSWVSKRLCCQAVGNNYSSIIYQIK